MESHTGFNDFGFKTPYEYPGRFQTQDSFPAYFLKIKLHKTTVLSFHNIIHDMII